jgi:8-oxo-dGTP pyrophosphatase MutT (NUDIX family)
MDDAKLVYTMRQRLKSGPRNSFYIDGFRRAAVLVPLLWGPDGLRVLFTVRAGQLAKHPGQIAFPGGQVENGEEIVNAALRETSEEIGLQIDVTSVVGCLDDQSSPARYIATPVVAVHQGQAELQLNTAEVSEAFTISLEELREVEPTMRVGQRQGKDGKAFSYACQGREIWGFTGNILHNFLRICESTEIS